ncbi:MAG TPA: hypothetical protein GXX30_05770 [Firmicutes bacterium]|nr:hypothetical protein [Candidatus Fermentithermobacillaceae bacterium]
MSWKDCAELGKVIITSRPILFCGSGLSMNAGFPGASCLASRLCKALQKHGLLSGNGTRQLAEAAQIAKTNKWTNSQLAEALFGKAHPAQARHPWYTFEESCEMYLREPPAISLSIPHLVIARLAREGLISEILTTNYDVCLEFACWACGMERQTDTEPVPPSICKDYFRVLNKESYQEIVSNPSVLYIAKLHGSIDEILDKDPLCNSPVALTKWSDQDGQLAIAFEDLVGWSVSRWARSFFEDRVKSRILLVTGFSASDPYLFGTLLECLRQNEGNNNYKNRVYALDPAPNTYLKTVVQLTGSIETCLLTKSNCCHCNDASACMTYEILEEATSKDDHDLMCKAKMACLYLDLYCATIRQLLLAHLETVGLPTLLDMVSPDNLILAYETKEELSRFLEVGSLPNQNSYVPIHTVIFSWLPKALANAQILTAATQGNLPGRTDKWSRRHFYYPILLDLPMAYLLLAALLRIAYNANRPEYIILEGDGTITLLDERNGFRTESALLLPLKRGQADTEAAMVRAMKQRRFFNLTRSMPAAKPVIVISDEDKSRSKNKDSLTLWDLSYDAVRRYLHAIN